MPFIPFYDCSNCVAINHYVCNSGTNGSKPVQCTTCCSGCTIDPERKYIQKQLQRTVRVPTRQYLDNLTALTVRGDSTNKPQPTYNNVNQSQASDRQKLHTQKSLYLPPSTPKLRPGKMGPGGTGVDVKHNSFARILARKKAQNLRQGSETYTTSTPLYGNKIKTYGIANSSSCICNSNFSLSFY